MLCVGVQIVRTISVQLKQWCQLLLICLIYITFGGIPKLYGQLGCPAPWNTAASVYGIVTLDGSGNGSSGGFTQTVNQHAVAAGQLNALGLGSCTWQAVPFAGFGQMKTTPSPFRLIPTIGSHPAQGTRRYNGGGKVAGRAKG